MKDVDITLTEQECWRLLTLLFQSQWAIYGDAMLDEEFRYPITNSVDESIIEKIKKTLNS